MPSIDKKEKKIIEAFLFAADEPLDLATLQSKVKKNTDVLQILNELQNEYQERGINLIKLANRWSFRTSIDLADQLKEEITGQKKLSKAAIETLAIIAYHQPVTRSEIEEIRGVSFSTGTMEVLFELGWVKPAGRKDIPGKPLAYGTTDSFLSHFNLNSLEDLPNSDELMAAGLIDSRVDSSIFGTSKFTKEDDSSVKENIFSNIDEMISDTLDNKDTENKEEAAQNLDEPYEDDEEDEDDETDDDYDEDEDEDEDDEEDDKEK
jgi:segregation and condensation protein B